MSRVGSYVHLLSCASTTDDLILPPLQVNISYILWIAAFNTSFLLGYLALLDIWIFGLSLKGTAKKGATLSRVAPPSVQQEAVVTRGNPPWLLEVVNRHSLAVFLLVRVSPGR